MVPEQDSSGLIHHAGTTDEASGYNPKWAARYKAAQFTADSYLS